MRLKWTLILACLTVVAAVAQPPYVHQKLGNDFEEIGNGILSTSGIPAWSASLTGSPSVFDLYLSVGTQNYSEAILGSGDREARPIAFDANGRLLWEGRGTNTSSFFDAFVNSDNISQAVLGGSRDALGFDFAPNGQPLWYGRGSNTGGQYDLFYGTTNLSASVLGSNREAFPAAVNRNGVLAWDGYGSNTGGLRDVFKTVLATSNTTNLSRPLFGAFDHNALARDINDNDRVLWEGLGTATLGWNDVFRDSTNISQPVLGTGLHDAVAAMLNNNDDVLWDGFSTVTSNYYDTFRNSTNLSRTPLGTGDHDAFGVMLNSSGHVLWEGTSVNTSFYYDVFLWDGSATRNISRTTLGTTAQHDAVGLYLDENGNVIWLGASTTTSNNKYNLYYHNRAANTNTNLTQSALGRNEETTPLAINGAGQILWAAPEANGTLLEVWLSTPNRPTTLGGTATLDRFVGSPTQVQLRVELIDPFTSNPIQTSNTNLLANSTYQVTVNQPGYWVVRISAPRFLKRRFAERRVLDNTVLDVSLTNGDADGDNTVGNSDLSAVLSAFGSSTNNPVDLNGDGKVDDRELAITLSNFGATGDS